MGERHKGHDREGGDDGRDAEVDGGWSPKALLLDPFDLRFFLNGGHARRSTGGVRPSVPTGK